MNTQEVKDVSEQDGSSQDKYHEDNTENEFHDASENMPDENDKSQMNPKDSKQIEMKQFPEECKDSTEANITEGPKESTSPNPDGDEVSQNPKSSTDSSCTASTETPQSSKQSEDSVEPLEAKQVDSKASETKLETSTAEKETSTAEKETSTAEKETSTTEKETSTAEKETSKVEKETSTAEKERPQEESSTSMVAEETSGSSNTGTPKNGEDTQKPDTLSKGSSDKTPDEDNGNPENLTSQVENNDKAGHSKTASSEGKISDVNESKSGQFSTTKSGESAEGEGIKSGNQDDGQTKEVDACQKEIEKQPTSESEEDESTASSLICACPGDKKMTGSTVDPDNFDNQSKFKTHSNTIKYWCELCSQPCCKRCADKVHGNCSHVSKCDNFEAKMKDVLQERREKMTKNLGELEKIESVSDREKEVLKNKDEVLSAIRKTCDDVIRLAKEKEKELRDEVEDLTQQQLWEIQKDEIKRRETVDEYNRSLQEIDKHIDSNNLEEVFASFNQISRQWPAIPEGSSLVKRVAFLKDDNLRYYPREFELGTIDVIETKRSKATDYSFDPLDPTDISNISETNCDPDDIVVVMIDDSEVLIVTDYINECVKAFYSVNGKPRRSQLDLDYRPHSITAITDNFLAVCYWNHNQITFIKAYSNLSEWSSAYTRRNYKCITALDSQTLAAGSSHPSSIDIIDLQGTVKATIAEPYGGWTLVDTPRSMCTINGNILVSDAGSKSLYCLTRRGKKVFQYAPENDDVLQWPRGVAVTRSGNILLADRYNNKVIQLTETGEYVKDLLTKDHGLLRPQGLCVFEDKLYVSQEEDNDVKIFKLSELCA